MLAGLLVLLSQPFDCLESGVIRDPGVLKIDDHSCRVTPRIKEIVKAGNRCKEERAGEFILLLPLAIYAGPR
jgi:hypothetical protein